MKIAIMGASFDTGNMGVSVLGAGCVLNTLRQFPDAEVYFLNYSLRREVFVVSSGAEKTAHTLVPLRFSKYPIQPNNIFLLTGMALTLRLLPQSLGRDRLIRRNALLSVLLDTDLFVSIAGGDSFSDIYGTVRLLYVTLPQILALLLGGRLALLPQTIGPFRSRFSKVVARYILRRAEIVYSRDESAISAICALARMSDEGKAKVKFSYDLGFQVPAAELADVVVRGLPFRLKRGSPAVGVNVSGLLWNEGHRFGLALDYRRLVIEAVCYFVEVAKVPVVLVPHVVCAGAVDSDVAAIHELFAMFAERYPGAVGMVEAGLSYDETKFAIGCFDYFIGARMHACIAALSQAVPCSALAYSGKFEGVMASVGVEEVTIDLRSVDVETAMRRIQLNYEDRFSQRHRLARTMSVVKETIATV